MCVGDIYSFHTHLESDNLMAVNCSGGSGPSSSAKYQRQHFPFRVKITDWYSKNQSILSLSSQRSLRFGLMRIKNKMTLYYHFKHLGAWLCRLNIQSVETLGTISISHILSPGLWSWGRKIRLFQWCPIQCIWSDVLTYNNDVSFWKTVHLHHFLYPWDVLT